MKIKEPCKTHGLIACECGIVISRCKCRGRLPAASLICFHWQDPRDLMEELIKNAAGGHEEHPARMVWACHRIAKALYGKPTGINIDKVFVEIQNQVKIHTGRERLPGQALVINKLN